MLNEDLQGEEQSSGMEWGSMPLQVHSLLGYKNTEGKNTSGVRAKAHCPVVPKKMQPPGLHPRPNRNPASAVAVWRGAATK